MWTGYGRELTGIKRVERNWKNEICLPVQKWLDYRGVTNQLPSSQIQNPLHGGVGDPRLNCKLDKQSGLGKWV